MGRRDFRHREQKKQKKTAKKPGIEIVPTPAPVEVIKRGKRAKEEEWEK